MIYDETETKEGDSLIQFMDSQCAARVVFLFLSPEYFQSAYTLYELIRITEWANLDQRFIFPLRLTEDIDIYHKAKSKYYLDAHSEIGEGLAYLGIPQI